MTPGAGGTPSSRGWEAGLAWFAVFVVGVFVLFMVVFLLFGTDEALPGSGPREQDPADDRSRRGDTFVGSFAFFGLLGAALLLGAVAAWSRRRGDRQVALRHAIVAAVMTVFLFLFVNASTQGPFTYRQFSWNRAFATTSVVLYAATLAIGPLARLWSPAKRAVPWRRETGVWATIAAVLHVGIYWEGRFGWGGWREFFYPPGPEADTALTFAGGSAYHVANVVGLVALVYALALALTSNDASQRWLKKGWSWLQARSTTLWLLVLLHAWLFAYFVAVGSSIAIGTLWASFWVVLLLQTAAFIKTVWGRQE